MTFVIIAVQHNRTELAEPTATIADSYGCKVVEAHRAQSVLRQGTGVLIIVESLEDEAVRTALVLATRFRAFTIAIVDEPPDYHDIPALAYSHPEPLGASSVVARFDRVIDVRPATVLHTLVTGVRSVDFECTELPPRALVEQLRAAFQPRRGAGRPDPRGFDSFVATAARARWHILAEGGAMLGTEQDGFAFHCEPWLARPEGELSLVIVAACGWRQLIRPARGPSVDDLRTLAAAHGALSYPGGGLRLLLHVDGRSPVTADGYRVGDAELLARSLGADGFDCYVGPDVERPAVARGEPLDVDRSQGPPIVFLDTGEGDAQQWRAVSGQLEQLGRDCYEVTVCATEDQNLDSYCAYVASKLAEAGPRPLVVGAGIAGAVALRLAEADAQIGAAMAFWSDDFGLRRPGRRGRSVLLSMLLRAIVVLLWRSRRDRLARWACASVYEMLPTAAVDQAGSDRRRIRALFTDGRRLACAVAHVRAAHMIRPAVIVAGPSVARRLGRGRAPRGVDVRHAGSETPQVLTPEYAVEVIARWGTRPTR